MEAACAVAPKTAFGCNLLRSRITPISWRASTCSRALPHFPSRGNRILSTRHFGPRYLAYLFLDPTLLDRWHRCWASSEPFAKNEAKCIHRMGAMDVGPYSPPIKGAIG